jgi:hypothetical protein
VVLSIRFGCSVPHSPCLAGVVVVSWGIIGATRLIIAAVGRPFRFRPRRVLIAAAISTVPFCLFKLATWYPELSEWSLKGLTASEVIARAGYPHFDSRNRPDFAPTDDVHLLYCGAFTDYSVVLHEGRVVKVVTSESDK